MRPLDRPGPAGIRGPAPSRRSPEPRRNKCGPLGASVPQQPPASATVEEDPVEDDKGLFHNITKAIRDLGFGRTSVWEGSIGLMLVACVGILYGLLSWIKGSLWGKSFTGYQAVMQFPYACGITVGTPVRIRGVPVGTVMNVRPSLEHVDVLVEVRDHNTVIPRNSVIQANQSGLIAEPLIDITPQLPVPDYKSSPLDPDCKSEGSILCHQGRIEGEQGVSLDEMIYLCTKMARQMDGAGMDSMLETAKAAEVLMKDAKPLLEQAVLIASEVAPLLKELREGGVVGNIEGLTAAATDAAKDIHALENEVLTKENIVALRDSVKSLTKTLGHIESISGSVGAVASDSSVQKNMRQLVQALSRMVEE